MEARDRARELLGSARNAVAFTGAGVSTPSGIPDFRSPGGLWTRHRPVTFPEFVASADARRAYWRIKREAWTAFADARPNVVHRTLARWEGKRLRAVVTQNIDGLHQEAGSRRVVEVHGTARRVECLGCGRSTPAAEVFAALDEDCTPPACITCGGWLKPATISFGQMLKPEVIDEAFALATAADVLLVLGSSLVVYPAAAVPEAAADAGVPVVIVNREPTPLDARAAAVLHGEVQDLVAALD